MKQIEFISLDKLNPSGIILRPSGDPGSLEDLISSIRQVGILHPIIVNFINDKYEIVSGTRRIIACEALKIPTIPAFIITASIEDAQIIRLHENLFREDLNPVDEASGLLVLERDYHLTREKIASLMGKSKGWVTQRLDILTWLPELISALRRCDISFSVAREISRIQDTDDFQRILSCCIESGATVKVVCKWVGELISKRQLELDKTALPELADISKEMDQVASGPCFTCENDHPAQIHVIGVCDECYVALLGMIKAETPAPDPAKP